MGSGADAFIEIVRRRRSAWHPTTSGRARRPVAGRYLRSLYFSTALATVLCAGAGPARAQSVTGSGNVYGAVGSTTTPLPTPPLTTWSIPTQDLNVGLTATGTLTIEGGGSVSDNGAYVGNVSTGTVTVSGSGSTWHNSSVVNIGYGGVPAYTGTGTLTIEDGGYVYSGVPGSSNTDTAVSGIIGTFYAGVGTVTVSGTDADGNASTWENAGQLMVGRYGKGTLNIEGGGTVSNADDGYIGVFADSTGTGNGTVTVSGTDGHGHASTWAGSADLYVSVWGTGMLNIEAGGVVSNVDGVIGYGNTGTVTVSGTDGSGNPSAWNSSGDLYVSYYGDGTLTVEDGGLVSNGDGLIGYDNTGTVTVTGTDGSGNASAWNSSGDLYVGYYGDGTLTIANGARASASGIDLAENAGSVGTINIGAAAGEAAVAAGTLDVPTVDFVDGTGTLVFNHTGATTFAAALTSTGSGTHALDHYAGTTTLTGDSSGFQGTTTVYGGTLLVGDESGNGKLGGGVNVGADGTLGGSGTILGAATIDGTLSAGNSPGTLTFANDLTLNATSTSVFELNSPGVVGGTGAAGNDLVVVAGDLTLAGTLSAHVAAAGYYRLFNYGGTLSGSFSGGTLTGTGGFVPVAANNPDIQYGIPNQVNLSVLAAGQTMQFWDGPDTVGNGVVDGGTGTWSAAGTNWTGRPGEANINGTWGGSVGVFAGAAGGAVTVAGTQSFDTLQFSTNGYTLQGGALAIGVAGGSTFNIDSGIFATVASSIGDGAGSALRKTGAGTLVLSGTNGYTGGTSLLGGVLSVSADANLGAAGGGLTFNGGTLANTASFDSSRAVTLDTAGTIDVAAATTLGLDGAIGGSGTLLKQGTGTLVLGGANSYGGGTTVAAGTVVGNAASIRGDLASAGSVIFDQAGNASFGGNIAGYGGIDGTMTKRGAGVLTLGGTSSLDWSIEAGGLVSASDRFSGNAAISSGASFAFDQTTSGTYAGVLSGTGSFVKTGSGNVLLTGDSSAFGGTTSVSGGTLNAGQSGSGALGGTVNVLSGASLGGTGNLGSPGSVVTIAAGGVHAPGASQAVLGDYVNHGTLQIEASPTAANRIVVAGGVDITGATLDLVLSPTNAASWNVFNGPFTIIDKQSAGTVTGTFGTVTQNLLFLDAQLAYDGGDGNDVTLKMVRNDLDFASVGQTRNQIATGAAIDTLGSSNVLWRSIALTSNPDIVRKSFDALSGEIHASARTALIDDSRFVRDAINDRIRAAFATPGAARAPVLSYGPGETPVLVSPDYAGPVFWSYGFGSWGSIGSDGNAAALKHSTGGLLFGMDGLAGDWRLGFMAGYSHSRFSASDRFSSGDSDNYHVGVYGGTEWGNLAFRSGLAYTWHQLDIRRSVAIPGFSDSPTAKYNGGTAQAFGEFGYGINAGPARFEPFANLAYVNLYTGDFAEHGGAAALTGRGDTTGVTFTTLGARAETGFSLWGTTGTLRGMLGWRHAFGDTVPTATQAFSGSSGFTIAGVPIARDSAVVEAGLDLNLSPSATLGLSYTGQLASGAHDHGFKANLAIRF